VVCLPELIPRPASESGYFPSLEWRRGHGTERQVDGGDHPGGLKLDQAKRLKELERENDQLRKAVSELTLDKQILKEALTGKYIIVQGLSLRALVARVVS
jgi:hypothetical protein